MVKHYIMLLVPSGEKGLIPAPTTEADKPHLKLDAGLRIIKGKL